MMEKKRSSDLYLLLMLAMSLLILFALGCDIGSSSSSGSSSGSNSAGCDGGSGTDTGDSYVTTTFQAENATIVPGIIESKHSGYTGSGYANTDNSVGSYIEFSLTAAHSGEYELTFFYAVESGNRYGSIQVNGSTVVSNINFNATGAWTTWDTASVSADLNAGANTIRVTAEQSSGLPNIDKMDIYGFALTQSGSTNTDTGTDTNTDNTEKTFIITAVRDNLNNNDMNVFANGLSRLGYTKVLEDTNVYSSELIDYLGRTITTLYHTGHGYYGVVSTYDGSVAASNVTLRAQNTIFASCLSLTDTSWKNSFTSTAQTLMGYTKLSYDYTDDTVAQNMVSQLGNNRTYKLAWYLANSGINGLSDRWAEYVREGSSIVEYSARTGNTAKLAASQSVLLEAKGRVSAVEDLASSTEKFQSSFDINATIEKAAITTTAESDDFDLTRPVTISEQDAVSLAKDWLSENNGLPDDAVIDQVIPVQRQSDDESQPEIVGYSVRFQRSLQGTKVCGNRVEDHISLLVDQNSVVAVSQYWPALKALVSVYAKGQDVDDLLSVGEAIQTAADEIAIAVKQDEPIQLIDVEPVYGTLGPSGRRGQKLIPAFRVRSADGHLFVISALTGRLLL